MTVTDKETMRCVICESLFFPSRKDARFCSAKCRKAASRGGIKGGKLNPEQGIYSVASKALYNLAALDKQSMIKSLILLALELLNDANKKKVYEQLKHYPFDEK